MPEPTSNEPDDGGRSTDDGGGSEMRLVRSFGVTRRVPDGVLSPEAVARLRAGGELTPEELARVRAAALGEGPLGRLVGGLLAEGEGARPGDAREAVHGADDDAPDTVIVPGNLRRFEFEWRPKDRREEAEPTTYYEALTGQRDPARDFFITARRFINAVVWVIALGLPVAVIVLTMATGQPTQTVVIAGVAAAVVGQMFRASFPRTPFG
jgi:hypothetical protein